MWIAILILVLILAAGGVGGAFFFHPARRNLRQLKSDNADVRMHALQELEEASKGGLIVLPLIVQIATEDHDSSLREQAGQVLAARDKLAQRAMPLLAQALGSKDSQVRQRTMLVLGKLGKKAALAVPFLVTALRDSDINIRRQSVRLLGRLGKEGAVAAPILLEIAVTDPDNVLRQWAMEALGEMGEASAAVAPALAEVVLTDESARGRDGAMKTLERLNENGGKAVPVFTKALKDPQEETRVRAASALWRMTNHAPVASSEIVQAALKDPSEKVLEQIAQMLSGNPDVGALAVPLFAKALESGDENVRFRAAKNLGIMGETAQPAAVNLAKAIVRDSVVKVVDCASDALKKLGGGGEDVNAILREAFDNPDSKIRARAARALGGTANVSGDVAQKLARTIIMEKAPEVRLASIKGLVCDEENLASGSAVFAAALDSRNPKVREGALAAIVELKSYAPVMMPELLKVASERNGTILPLIVTALKNMGDDRSLAVCEIMRVNVNHEDPKVRDQAEQVLREVLGESYEQAISIPKRYCDWELTLASTCPDECKRLLDAFSVGASIMFNPKVMGRPNSRKSLEKALVHIKNAIGLMQTGEIGTKKVKEAVAGMIMHLNKDFAWSYVEKAEEERTRQFKKMLVEFTL